ncbi:aminodeoxychorismate synthase component I [Paenibacillus bouchesdurhonensis]|uniref:aminodeoxychorismate synthase component I n=1 Tax=Paenibacillus bouchesdurhonensis TaxID=1870990 RepID=UPI002D21D97B|nr:aminodeoxychorismate synthase component I [Paenibacillus bouchesdurhonensis]
MANLDSGPFILMDFMDEHQEMQRRVFTDPVEIMEAVHVSEVRPVLQRVQDAVDQGYYAVGYVSYEAAPAFDSAFQVHSDVVMPLVWFGIFRGYEPEMRAAEAAEANGSYHISEWTPTTSEDTYHECIHQIRESIAKGDTYQVNYTMRLRAQFAGDTYAYYKRLCDAQQARYSAMLHLGDFSILSASPELFFRKSKGIISTRPMKGTVKRGLWLEEDERLAQWLRQSVKNQAENVMITDLLRNDLGIIAEPGTVQVPNLFDVEKYFTLFQMTSTVTAIPKADVGMEEIFSALFPCGSITGAPKISTMGLIQQLENSPREIYCGAIGMLSPDGSAVFNVAIRTVWIDHRSGQAEYGVGGGITWDSTAADEYAEAKTKALLLTEQRPKFELLESFRLENGQYTLLEEHLERIRKSAAYFDYCCDIEEIRRILEEHAVIHNKELRKARLLLSADGSITVQSEPISEISHPLNVVLASESIDSKHRFLYHKTTYRQIYEQHARHKGEAFDVLLWNEKGELTEFTMGNVVVEMDGCRYTPPRESGLLAGIFRSKLLQEGRLEERRLTLDDIKEATQVWLINSVRGWVPVEITQKSLDDVLHKLMVY